MITPKVMRRTPKITGNLSSCAEDWKAVESYKRMGKVFMTHPCMPSNSDSSEGSYDASYGFSGAVGSTSSPPAAPLPTRTLHAHFIELDTSESSQSADNDDRDSDPIGCTSDCPKCPCKRTPSSTSTLTTIDCCRRSDHAACVVNGNQRAHNISPTSVDYSNGVTSPSVKAGVLESHFPVFSGSHDEEKKTSEKASLIPVRTNKQVKIVSKKGGTGKTTIASTKRQLDSHGDDQAFSRNESSLPLLSNLNERSSPSRFVKRKKCVFPVESSPRPSPSKTKTESSV